MSKHFFKLIKNTKDKHCPDIFFVKFYELEHSCLIGFLNTQQSYYLVQIKHALTHFLYFLKENIEILGCYNIITSSIDLCT